MLWGNDVRLNSLFMLNYVSNHSSRGTKNQWQKEPLNCLIALYMNIDHFNITYPYERKWIQQLELLGEAALFDNRQFKWPTYKLYIVHVFCPSSYYSTVLDLFFCISYHEQNVNGKRMHLWDQPPQNDFEHSKNGVNANLVCKDRLDFKFYWALLIERSCWWIEWLHQLVLFNIYESTRIRVWCDTNLNSLGYIFLGQSKRKIKANSKTKSRL